MLPTGPKKLDPITLTDTGSKADASTSDLEGGSPHAPAQRLPDPSPSWASWLLTSHLLDGSQAMQLGIAKLLLEHKLVEVLGRIGLTL